MSSLSKNWKNAVTSILLDTQTPFYVFRTNKVVSNLVNFKHIFSIKNRQVDFFYSIKTNPALEILSVIHDAGWGLLASSEGDLKSAKQIKSNTVVFDAPFKKEIELQTAWGDLGALMVCENATDLDNLTRFACAGRPMKVDLRIMIPRSISGHLSRFGFELEPLVNDGHLEKLRKLKAVVSVSSLHFHLGGQPAVPEQFYRLANFAAKVWKEFSLQGFEICTLGMGGGFPCSLSEERLKKYSDAVNNGLEGNSVPEFVKISFEPGRAIVEDAGVLCVKVVDVSIRQGEVFALVNGGSNLVMPTWMIGDKKRKIQKLQSGSICECQSTGRATVVGPLCAENDKIGQIEDSFGISNGDILIIRDCGAYDWSTRYHFGCKMPHTFIVDQSCRSEIIENTPTR